MQSYDSNDPQFVAADELMNQCRLATCNPAQAELRIEQLQNLLATQPDYPHRGMTWYFLGMHQQQLQQYGAAVSSFKQALYADPQLLNRTPIQHYIMRCKRQDITQRGPVIATAIAGTLLLLALIVVLAKPPPGRVWRRTSLVYGGGLALWLLLVVLVPVAFGPVVSGTGDFPQPVYIGHQLQQPGHQVLWQLLTYGSLALIASALVSLAASRLSARNRAPAAIIASLVVIFLILGSGYLRHWHGRFSIHDGQVVFLVREIAWKQDVPDEMLPLFDEDFRNRIIQAKQETKK